MNPVQQLIREHVETHGEQWRSRAEPVPTRAGPRYPGAEVAALLAPPLSEVGLQVFEEYEVRLFVTAKGRHSTRAELESLIKGSLEGHNDPTLRDSIGSHSFWLYLADRLPSFEGDLVRPPTLPARSSTEYGRAFRARRADAETASSRAFIAAVRLRLLGTRVVAQDLFDAATTNITRKVGEAIDHSEDPEYFVVPRRRPFYKVADAEFGERRRHARGTAYVVQSLVRLTPRVADLLREAGVEDPEAHADELSRRVSTPKATTAPDAETSKIVASLPLAIAVTLASVDEPKRAFVRSAREWIRRHPDDRAALQNAAASYSAALIEAARIRVASNLSAQQESAPRHRPPTSEGPKP